MALFWCHPSFKLALQFTNFLCSKETRPSLQIVQDFRELNNHTHIDKYSLKEIHECIGDIGRANSTIFLPWTSQVDSGRCRLIIKLNILLLSWFLAKDNSNGLHRQSDYWDVQLHFNASTHTLWRRFCIWTAEHFEKSKNFSSSTHSTNRTDHKRRNNNGN